MPPSLATGRGSTPHLVVNTTNLQAQQLLKGREYAALGCQPIFQPRARGSDPRCIRMNAMASIQVLRINPSPGLLSDHHMSPVKLKGEAAIFIISS
jgi:hypothetical protein